MSEPESGRVVGQPLRFNENKHFGCGNCFGRLFQHVFDIEMKASEMPQFYIWRQTLFESFDFARVVQVGPL